MSYSKWFHRGKEARALGCDRIMPDARLSLASRQQFFAGWDEQNRFLTTPSAEQLAEADRVRAKLRNYAALMRLGLEGSIEG